MNMKGIVAVATLLCVICSVQSQAPRRRRPRPLQRGPMQINIQDKRAMSVQIGFTRVSGAASYKISAKEWIDGSFEQTVATSEERVGIHNRNVILKSLIPGREFLIQVQALRANGRRLQSVSEILTTTNLRCYTCNGRASNSECRYQDCPRGTDSCLNEVRFQNGRKTISKRCAQFQPRLARVVQNGVDITKACSGTNTKDAVCRCMCKSDLCNKAELPCGNTCFPRLTTRSGLTLSCTRENTLGSICSWKCREGERLIGTSSSTCRTDRTWSVLTPPRCVKPVTIAPPTVSTFICPVLSEFRSGDISCTNRNRLGSVCTYSCDRGYSLIGSETRTCRSGGRWSGTRPSCTVIRCPTIPTNILADCTRSTRLGSTCELTCANQLTLVGISEITCLSNGRWSNPLPTCVRRGCQARPRTGANVLSECEDFEAPEVGATCEYSCRAGYVVQGQTTLTCTKNRWDGSPPTCIRTRCQPALSQPPFGFITCSSQQNFGSVCTFKCHSDYVMVGEATSTCTKTTRWSSPEPRCQAVACPRIGEFSFGSYSCNNDNRERSTCSFRCTSGYGFPAGARNRITCRRAARISGSTASTGVWTYPVPQCQAIRCSALVTENGLTRSCNRQDYRSRGTTCTFRCQPGYAISGRSRTTCINGISGRSAGRWSAPTPLCIRKKCRPLARIVFGDINCSDGVYAGSVCTATCDRGYEPIGNTEITCNEDSRWSSRNPTCQRVVCKAPRLPSPENFVYECGRKNPSSTFSEFFTDFECPLSCSVGFSITGGNTTMCGDDGNWIISQEVTCNDVNECVETSENPCEQVCDNYVGGFDCSCGENYVLEPDQRTCRLIVCPEFKEDPQRTLDCSDGRLIGSTCQMSCSTGYEPRGGASTFTCRPGGSWDREQATCMKVECVQLSAPVNGAINCTDNNLYQSLCLSECNEGYEMLGFGFTECTSRRVWTFDTPTCSRIQCPVDAISLTNGIALCTDSTFYDSSCQYFCDAGYKLSGIPDGVFFIPFRSCTAEGRWTESAPVCEKKQCLPIISDLEAEREIGTIVCSDEDLFKSTCTITCPSVGYELIGQNRITCLASQEWSQVLGHCQKVQCPSQRIPTNGNVKCSDINFYESECSYTCEIGHQLIGSDISRCQADRTWSSVAPTCERIRCADDRLSIPSGTAICTESNLYDSICSTTCNPGYIFDQETPSEQLRKTEIVGSFESGFGGQRDIIESTCLASGDWSEMRPVCIKHTCQPSADFLDQARPNGQVVCTDGSLFQSVCRLVCDVGYEVVDGDDVMECEVLAQWESELGQCQRVMCEAFESFENGVMECGNNFRFESNCLFTCDAGYELIGESSSVCQSDRTFSNEQPFCQRITCPASHIVLENGNATCTDGFRFESRCEYVCNPGYEMISSPDALAEDSDDVAVLTCEADRSWSGELPFCKRKRCSKLDGALIKARLNGEVSCTESDFFGSECTVTCREGYVLVGSSSTHCSANADWEPTIGYCERIQCPEINLPANSAVLCSNGNRFESNCTFTCNRGYELIGPSSSACLADKTYSDDFPTCREILCPVHFTTLQNGIATCSDTNKFASRCDYECAPGYKLSEFSSRSATCRSNYNWDAETNPTCEKKACSQSDSILIQALQHGSIECTEGNLFQSQCTLTCDTGYELTEGSGVTNCRADQMWENGFGYCQKITCVDLELLNNGGVSCTEGNRFESVCSFNCDPGYELIGSASTTCQASREFDNQVPTCQKTKCPESHLSIENGLVSCTESNLFESVCSYECSSGYEITSGSNESLCQDDQTWSKKAAECQKKICPFDHESLLGADENGHITCTDGFVFESSCSLDCDRGYKLIDGGNNVTRCGEDAEWENELDYCTKISCPAFDEIENGEMECSEDSLYLSNCGFTCISGYELIGLPVSSCQADMSWTSSMPECIKISCPRSFLSVDHGTTTCTSSNRFRSTCSYECDRGYEMSQSDVNSTTCNADRTWTNQKPTCSKKKCPANDDSLLKARMTGLVTCSEESFFESTCQLMCPAGYEIVSGQSEITCLDTAEWNDEIGFCRRIRCGEIETPSNADVSCSNEDQFESSCEFECNVGYFLLGEYSTTCLADRTYSSDVPECKKTNCSADHLDITFGSVTCTEENFFGSECSYTCDVGYHFFDNDFVTSEVMTSECLANQVWSEVIPICEKKTCPSQDEDFLLAHDTGKVVCSEANRFGTTCQITCDVGSELIGASTISCNSDGNWNETIGHCQIRECPLFEIPLLGELSCTEGQNYQSECQFVCDEGHHFRSDQGENQTSLTVVCQSDETWTVPILPECEKMGCPVDHLNEFEYGTINCTESNLFGTECLFQCDEGFELVNPRDARFTTSVVVTCQSDAQWDFPEPPRTRRISCLPNATSLQETEMHGKVSCTDGSDFESECTIECNRGYELVEGVESVTCGSEGEWIGLLGACEKIECEALTAPDNAEISCSDEFLFKSRCKITCDAGYDIVDPEDEYDRERGISCRADGSWCGDVPTCQKILCSDDHLSIENGFVECNDENIFGSTCRYVCDQGYHMIEGQSDSAECNSDGSWSSEVPICENNRCPANDTSLSEARINGDVTCTDENKFGSECRLKCYPGYEMTGEPETNCLHSGEWSNGLGLCQRITCVTPNTVPFTAIECSNDFKFQSLCVYNCEPGYERVDKGNSLIEITHDLKCEADGFWTGLEAECDKISCPTAGYIDMANGVVECTDSARFGSRCSFTCHPGFELTEPEGDDVTLTFVTCTATGAWDKGVPMCRPLSCTETSNDLDNSVTNGAVVCDNGSLFVSRCLLQCNDGYRPSNMFTSTSCGVDKKWWPQLSSCELVRCPFLETEGALARCTDENNLNSECTVTCEEENESGEVKCNSNGQWEGSLPSCNDYKCNEDYLYVENGNVDSENNEPGSTINYSCEEGFMLTGQSQVTCLGTGNWNSDKPSCEIMKCPPLNLVNGELICSNQESYNAIGSICSYSCNRLFELQGDEHVTCQSDGTWSSNEVPFCKGHCDLRFDSFENGEVNCTNDNYLHSKCSFRCSASMGVYQEPIALYGSDSMTCQENGRWDGTPPCCSRSCPPWAKVDLFFVLDSSSSVSFEGWRKVLDFVNQVIETFNVGPENALAGVFRFNRDVDVRGEIPIGKYDALSTLQHAITFLPYGGWGTNIGRALEHVTTNSLESSGNRPEAKDYVIVLTDGNSQDDITKSAQALKDMGATVFSIGFSDSDASLEQLKTIASNPSNAFIVNGSFDGLDSKLSQRITSSICENPCLLKQSYRTMMESYITN